MMVLSKQSKSVWIKPILKNISVPLVAVLLSALAGSFILLFSGVNPFHAYAALLQGALGGMAPIGRTFEKATPLIFSGLSVAFAFKAGLFNIGAQGQLLFGAVTAAMVGFSIHNLPAFLHIPLALLAGAVAGGLYSAFQGWLKAFTGAHEVITGIMLNYVALNMTDFLAAGPLKDTTPGNIIARTPLIFETCRIPSIGTIPLGFVIAVFAAIVVWWFLKYSTVGFEIHTIGINTHAARYSGINTRRTLILVMFISGLLAGVGGAIETQGIIHRFQPGFNIGLGFDGITIALLARIHPIGIIPSALLIGAMKAGSSQMQFSAGVAKEIIDVIQALILFFVAADVIIRRIIHTKDATGVNVSLSKGWGKGP